MTPSELKRKHLEAEPESYFFCHKTMKFFGDTMKNYGVRDAGDCWELWRKRPVRHNLQSSAYFNKLTFEQVFRKEGTQMPCPYANSYDCHSCSAVESCKESMPAKWKEQEPSKSAETMLPHDLE